MVDCPPSPDLSATSRGREYHKGLEQCLEDWLDWLGIQAHKAQTEETGCQVDVAFTGTKGSVPPWIALTVDLDARLFSRFGTSLACLNCKEL